MTEEFTTDQIAAAIPAAIKDRDFRAAVSLIHMLAVRDPDQARAMLDAIAIARHLAQAGDLP